MSWMRTAVASVVKLHESSAAMPATWAACTVTVQDSPGPKSAAGSSVNVVGPPVAVAACAPLVAHEIANQSPVTVVAWLNVIVRLESTGTSAAPAAGAREAIAVGPAPPHVCSGEAVLRGLGAAAAKSAPLPSVSWQPPSRRTAAVVFERAGAGAVPSKKSAPP